MAKKSPGQRRGARGEAASGRTCEGPQGDARTGQPAVSKARISPALEDNFAEAFKEARGKVDSKLKLGF